MATIIFDFDSTLIGVESLEEILRPKLTADEFFELETITSKGMEGDMPFRESLERRMSLVPLNRSDFKQFGEEALDYIVPGMESLVQILHEAHVDVWIVSGAIKECLYPVAKKLNIPEKNLIGVEPSWGPGGEVLDLGNYISKLTSAENVLSKWVQPIINVGDGITDWELYAKGVTQQFIAFTQIAKRSTLINLGAMEARDVEELKRQIRFLWNDKAILSS